MLNNMYNNYDKDCFDYYTTSTFDRRTKSYLIGRYTPRAEWDYEDTINIVFDLKECPFVDDSILNTLEGKYLKIKFYNFRYEEIPFEVETPALEHFSVDIDYETSKKYFDRGTYNCSISLISYSDNENSDINEYNTILPRERCSFYIR